MIDRAVVENMIQKTADRESLRAGYYATELRQQTMDFLFGYGPLQEYVDDPDVTDIDGTGPAEFTVKRHGQRMPIQVRFNSERCVRHLLPLADHRQGGQITTMTAIAGHRRRFRLPSMSPSRPAARTFPTVCIRKHRTLRTT
jgi:pilus assembly protein CpaF